MDINIMNTRVKVTLTKKGLDILKEYYNNENDDLYFSYLEGGSGGHHDLDGISEEYEGRFYEFINIFSKYFSYMKNELFVNNKITITNN